MLKKDIAFKDFEGREKVRTEYFHMSKTELVKLYGGEEAAKSFMDHMQVLIDKKDVKQMIESMETMVLAAYGKKVSEDTFDKGDGKYAQEFKGSLAYDALMLELMTNAGAASSFLVGIMPSGMLSEKSEVQIKMMARELDSGNRPVKDIIADFGSNVTSEETNSSSEMKAYETYSEDELMAMDTDQFNALVGTDITKMSQDQFNMVHRRRQLGRQ